MVFLNFSRPRSTGVSYAVPMTWRVTWRSSVRRCGAVAIAVASCGLVPAGSVWADDSLEPVSTPDQPVGEPAPETGEVDGATVAVGAPPVPPVTEAPQVAVGRPPVPPAKLLETVGAALDLVAACL